MNRLSTSTLADTTSYEVWVGKRPSLAHPKVFGCDSFVHIPKEKRSKLGRKSEKCIFIGYKDGVKGYKMWNLVTRTTVYSRDVIFIEFICTSKNEEVKRKKEPKKLEFDLRNESQDSNESTELEEEVEPQNPIVKRSG